MAHTIKLKRTSTAGNKPDNTNITTGELALNTADKSLYLQTGTANTDIITLYDDGILHLDDTNNRVGIGTTSPYYKLHTRFTNTNTSLSGGTSGNWGSNGIRIENTSSTAGVMALAHFRTGDSDWHIGNKRVGTDQADFIFAHEGSTKITINSNGQLGIGVTDFTNALHSNGKQLIIGSCFVGTSAALVVDDFSRFAGPIYFHQDSSTNAANSTAIDNNGNRLVITGKNGTTANALDAPDGFYVGGTQFINSSRNLVNIGTVTTSGNITANISSGGQGYILQSNSTEIGKFARTTVGSTVVPSLDGATGRDIHIGGVVNTDVILANAGGNVGIGTTTPSQKLDVQGTILVNNEIQFVNGAMRIFRSSDDMKIRTGNTDRITVSSTGITTFNSTVRADYITGVQQTGSFLDFDDDTTYGSNGVTLSSLAGIHLKFDTNNNDTNIFGIYANGGTIPVFKLTDAGAATFNNAFTLPTAIGSAGQVLKVPTSGTTLYWADESAASVSTSISDADGDTKIQVEETADEDKIRFDTAGSERMVVDSTGLTIGSATDTTTLVFPDKTGIPDSPTETNDKVQLIKMGQGGNGGMWQTTGRGGMLISSADDSLVLANGDVGRFYDPNAGGHHPGVANETLALLSDFDIRFTTGLQDGWNGGSTYSPKTSIITADGRFGIGTTSPATPLHVMGTMRSQPEGSSIFADYKNQQLYVSSGSYTIAVNGPIHLADHNNNKVLTVDNTNDRVGIGTTSPAQKLDVREGFIRVQSPDVGGVTPPALTIGQLTNAYQAGLTSSTHLSMKAANSAGNFYWYPNSTTPIMTLLQAGNLGIGTTSPSKRLDVSGDFQVATSTSSNAAYIRNSGTGTALVVNQQSTGDILRVDDNSVTKLIVKDGGNVGINTTSPEAKLHNIGHSRLDGAILQKSNLSIGSGNISTGNEYISHNGPILTNGSTGNINQYGYFRGYQAVYGTDGTNGYNPYAQGAYSNPVFEFVSNNRGSISLPTDSAIRDGYLYQFVLGNSGSGGSNGGVELTNSNTTLLWGITSSNHAYFANRVGIGNNSPNYALDVTATGGGINIGGTGAYLRWNSGDMQIKNEGSYKMGFYTYNSSDAALNQHMVIDTDGNVGIGTDSPDTLFHVYGSDSGASPYQNGNDGIIIERNGRAALNFLTPNTQDAYIFWADPEDANVAYLGYAHSSDQAVWKTGGTFRLQGGRVDIDEALKIKHSSTVLDITGDASTNTYFASTGEIRVRPNGTTINKIVLNASYLNAPAYQVGGTEVIDSSRNISSGNITTTGYLRGPSTFTIDPSAHGDNTGTVVIAGNLQVDGTTTTINSTTLTVDDLNITLASGAANAAAANGAGITVDTAGAQLTYDATQDRWNMNKGLELLGTPLVVGTGATDVGRVENSSGVFSLTAYTGREIAFGNDTNGEHVRIDTDGNVGIGTSSPGKLLHVTGQGKFEGRVTIEDNAVPLMFNQADQSNGTVGKWWRMPVDGTSLRFDVSLTNDDAFSTYRDVLTLTTSGEAQVHGKLAVNNRSATAYIDSVVPDGNALSLRLGRADQSSYWDFNHAGNDLRIYNNDGTGSDVLIGVNSGGGILDNKVGIGTATPTQKLDVAGIIKTGGIAHPEIELVPSGSVGNADIRFDGTSFDIRSNSSSAYLTLQTSTTERLKITNTGNFEFNNGNFTEVGTVSSGAITSSGNLLISKTDPTITLFDNSGANTNPNGTIIFSEVSGTNNFKINYNGQNDRLEFRGLVGTTDTELVRINRGTNPALHIFGRQYLEYSVQATANKAYGLVVRGNDSGSTGEAASIFLGGIQNTVRGAYLAAEIQSSSNDHDLIIATSGPSAEPSERMRVTGDGKVGIGQSSPSAKLHVKDSSFPQLKLEDADDTMEIGYSGQNFYFKRNDNDGSITFRRADNSDIMAVNMSTKRVGIGTATPTYGLQVMNDQTSQSATGTMYVQASLNGSGKGLVIDSNTRTTADNSVAALQTITRANTTGLKVQVDGNVGIGTDSPTTRKLEVYHSANAATGILVENANTGTGAYAGISFKNDAGGSVLPGVILNGSNQTAYAGANSLNVYQFNENPIGFVTGNTLRMSVRGDGKVGVGTNSPQGKFQVNGDIIVTATDGAYTAEYFARLKSSYNENPLALESRAGDVIRASNYGQNLTFLTGSNANGTSERMTIDANGNIVVGVSTPFSIGGTAKLSLSTNTNVYLTAGATSSDLIYSRRYGSGHYQTQTYLNNNTGTLELQPYGGNVGIGTSATVSSKLQVEALGIDTTTTTTSATTEATIDSFAAATFRSARYTIQVTNTTDSTYHITEILLIHNGTTPNITEYGTVFTGTAAEATFDADISSGNVRLRATPASTDSMTFKVVRHCITV